MQRAEAEEEAAQIQKQKEEQEVKSAKIAEINKKAQEMLEDTLPVKQKAKAALETITVQDMNELGSYLKGTPLIQLIFRLCSHSPQMFHPSIHARGLRNGGR